MPGIHHVLGIMSGSSLDGVDLAFCRFEVDDRNRWSFQILQAETVPFDAHWRKTLPDLVSMPAAGIIEKDILFGKYLGILCREFVAKYRLKPDFIASHGHTLFHQPARGYTRQIGHGQAIAIAAQLPVVCDFRTKDIMLGGQGAPLVPVGDELLFGDYAVCLNLGGIANLSFKRDAKRIAFDVCPANQLLNHLSRQLDEAFDRGGKLAAGGKQLPALYAILNTIDYYRKPAPKSLGNEDVSTLFIPVLDAFPANTVDKLQTVCRHIAFQVGQSVSSLPAGKLLVSGGGAFNDYLIQQLKAHTRHTLVIPGREVIEFREALIFAFLGLLRYRNEVNCYASVTGASEDSSTGVIYQP